MKFLKTILFLSFSLAFIQCLLDSRHHRKNVLQTNKFEKNTAKIVLTVNRALYPNAPTAIETFFDNFAPPQAVPYLANSVRAPVPDAKTLENAEINAGFAHYCRTKKGWTDFKQVSVKTLNGNPSVDEYMKPLLKFREISNIYVLYLAARRFLKLEDQYCPKGQAKTVNQLYTADTIVKFTKTLCQHGADLQYHVHDAFKAAIADFNTKNGADAKNIKVFVNAQNGFCVELTTDPIQRHGEKIKIKVCNFGSVTPYSDIDQTVEAMYDAPTAPTFTEKEKFVYFQCGQSEVVRAFDEVFVELFENTSFFIFDLNAYTSGFLEAEAKTPNLLSTNCVARTTMTNNYYCYNENTYPLNGIISFLHHFQSFTTTQNDVKQAIIRDMESIISFFIGKAKACIAPVTAIGSEILTTVKNEITTISQSVESNNLNSFLDSKSPKGKAPSDNVQKTYFLRNLGYYDYLTKVNKRLALSTATTVPTLISEGYTNKDTMNEVFHSVFTTNEAYYTAGAIIHVVGGQMGANGFLIKPDMESSFMLNFAMGYEHSIEFLTAYVAETNAFVKKYFLIETLSKLAKYLARTKKALNDPYSESCTSNTPKRLISVFNNNNPIPAVYTEIMNVLDDIKKVKDNKALDGNGNAINFSDGNPVVAQGDINGQINAAETIFRAFCAAGTRTLNQNQYVECVLWIFKEMSNFVNSKKAIIF